LRGFFMLFIPEIAHFPSHFGSLQLHQNQFSSPKFSDMRSTLIFYPNLSKKSSKTGKTPIYLRVISNGKAECRLNAELSDHELAKWNPIQMRLEERNSYVNDTLNAIDVEFKRFQSQNATNQNRYSAAEIRDRLLNKNVQAEPDIYVYCKNYYESSILSKSQLSSGTRKNYMKALNHMERFHAYKGFGSMKLSNIDATYVHSFWDYLLAKIPSLKKNGMTEVSASGVFKKFKTILDRAVDEKLATKNFFKLIKSKNKSPQRMKMNLTQVSTWYKSDLSHFPAFELYRDLYMFSSLTGLAYSDLISLRRSHLVDIRCNEILLKKSRHKTNELIEVVLVSYAKDIVAKYLSHPDVRGTDLVFPTRSLKSVNYYYQIIADKLGIQLKVTSHIARHTYRQILNEAGITESTVIRRMMGQSNGGSIDSVYFSVNEVNLTQAKESLQRLLDKFFLNDKSRIPK
jgi:integrase